MQRSPRSVPCATCGKLVDVIRAPRMRFSAQKTWYFCSSEHADAFDVQKQEAARPNDASASAQQNPEAGALIEGLPLALAPRATTHGFEPLPRPEPEPEPDRPPILTNQEPEARDEPDPQVARPAAEPVREEVDEVPIGEVFAPAEPPTATAPRAPKAVRRLSARSALAWAPVLLSAFATLLTVATEEDFWTPLGATFVLAISAYVGLRTLGSWDLEDLPARVRLEQRLFGGARRITSHGTTDVAPDDLRPGEEVLVTEGLYVPADGTITDGSGVLTPWEGAPDAITVGEGDRVVAGALLSSGRIQVACSRTGADRALYPLVAPPGARIDETVLPARSARWIADQGALGLGAVCAGLVWLQGGSYAAVLAVLASVWGAMSQPVARALPGMCCRRWLYWAARQGIAFPHARLVDQAATVSSAAFCVRGTVLHGEPEVAEIHPLREASEAEILALAAGAESVVHHPVATAVLRAAQVRRIAMDACRSHNTVRGMGVRCVTSTGDLLVLGSRELLLGDRISIAMAEATLRTLESRGLTTLMIARNGHLIGVLALQDSLRAGAKAAIQILIDERIEPVLISGDSRATTEAVAHALAVEHVRPEISAAGRAREVQSLQEAGANLAVIGTSPRDESALAAAPVPIVLGGASLTFRDAREGKERAIGLVSKQVIAAPLALLACRRIRSLGIRALVFSYLPAAAAAAGSASLLIPLYVAPILAAAGAAWAARSSLAADGPFQGLRAPPTGRI